MAPPIQADLLVPPVYREPARPADPDFLRAAEWLRRGASDPLAAVVGVPFSDLSLSGARCDLLPRAIRDALWSFSTYLPSREVDLSVFEAADAGDVRLSGLEPPQAMDAIRSVFASLRGGPPVAILGGDNSITAPALAGIAGRDASLLTLDAHHDVRTGLSNGSPVRVLLDEGLPGQRIWQVGIADMANSQPYSELALAAGITVVRTPEVKLEGIRAVIDGALSTLGGSGAVYVDVDLDVVERALAPGCPAAMPGGLAPSDVVEAAFMCGEHPSVVALDIVEVDPSRDVAEATVRLAAQVLLSFLAGVASR